MLGFRGQLNPFNFLELLDPALGLAGLGRFIPEPLDEGFGRGDLLLLIFRGGFKNCLILRLRFDVGIVVARVGDELLPVDLNDT